MKELKIDGRRTEMDPNGETFMDWYSRTRDYPRWHAEIAIMEDRPRWHNERFPEFEAEVSRRTKMDILLHRYRLQGRPQAHLDRVMRLGRV